MLRVCVSRQGRTPKVQICPFNELARRRSRQQSCSCGLPRAVAIVVALPSRARRLSDLQPSAFKLCAATQTTR